MKRTLLYPLILLCVVEIRLVALSQSFTFIPQDTLLYGQLGSEIVFNCTLRNISTQTLTLALIRTMNNLPQSWESSMCLSVCFPPTTDTVLTTPDFGSSPLDPGESRPFSVHVYPATNHGTGVVRILARNTRNAADNLVLTFTAVSVQTSVETCGDMPNKFSLGQNYPNPFNPTTMIGFQVGEVRDRRLEAGRVTLKVFDVLGREVATLVNEVKAPGSYEVTWDASGFPSGVYFYRLKAGGMMQTRRLILMK